MVLPCSLFGWYFQRCSARFAARSNISLCSEPVTLAFCTAPLSSILKVAAPPITIERANLGIPLEAPPALFMDEVLKPAGAPIPLNIDAFLRDVR